MCNERSELHDALPISCLVVKTAVEALLQEDPPNARGAWRRMKGWYKAAAKRVLPPARATLERITAEQTELYRRVPPPGENIPVNVDPTHIDDSVPT